MLLAPMAPACIRIEECDHARWHQINRSAAPSITICTLAVFMPASARLSMIQFGCKPRADSAPRRRPAWVRDEWYAAT